MCTICDTFRAIEKDECDYEELTFFSDVFARISSWQADDSASSGFSVANEGGSDELASIATAGVVTVGGSYTGTLGFSGDEDWVRISLTAGDTVVISLDGVGAGELSDPRMEVWDAAGTTLLIGNDDSGGTLDSQVTLTAAYTGDYFINATSYNTIGTGDYEITVVDSNMSAFSYDQISDYLVNGFWDDNGLQSRSFNVAVGGTITVNLTGLSAPAQNLATLALESWSNVTGLNFSTSISSGADIIFTDDNPIGGGLSAANSSSTIGTNIIQSNINISQSWLDAYGTELDGYSFGTYIHEIGHALGLGHGGYYNGSATYTTNGGLGLGYNHYLNDSWQASVMSYMSQGDNSYINASLAFNTTAQIADILAIQALYGTTGSLNTGNTTYGENGNTGGYMDLLAALNDPITFTIYDEGGTDTIDFGSATENQTITLAAEGISNVNGLVGNMIIARNTVIENVISGSGDDDITGNDEDNEITGGGGEDTVDGGAGTDTMVFSGNYAAYTITGDETSATVTIGGVTAQLTNIEQLQFDDQLFLLTGTPNTPPVVSLPNTNVGVMEWYQLGTQVSATDADGDTITTYEITDNDAGANNFWIAGGVGFVDATGGYTLTAAQMANLWIRGEAGAGTTTYSIRGFDGTDWSVLSTSDLVTTSNNTRPDVSATDVSVEPSQWAQVNSYVGYSDPEADPADSYEIWDSVGGNNFWLQGVGFLDASEGYIVTAAQLNSLWLRGDDADSNQTLWIRANDGELWSAWDSFNLETLGSNTAPIVPQADLTLDVGEVYDIGGSIAAYYSDADSDPAVSYEIWDSVGSDSFSFISSGAVDASTGHVVAAGALSDLRLTGNASAGDQTLWVRAYDGEDWGAWDSFVLTTDANSAPSATIENLTMTAGQTAALDTLITYVDPNGDVPVQYEVWDSVGGDNFFVDGSYVDASTGYVFDANLLAGSHLSANLSGASTETLWVRAYDGEDWGNWDQFDLTTQVA